MVGDLYNSPKYAGQRDSAFSIFYMLINVGSMFAPGMATYMCNKAMSAQGLVYQADLPAICNRYLDGAENGAELVAAAEASGMQVGSDISAWASHYIETLSTSAMATPLQ